ncbi:MAG: hypothetical protein PVJ25_00165 [Desulfuromonadales bacterium]
MNRIVIHDSKIALKGKNRRQVEDALRRHVRAAPGNARRRRNGAAARTNIDGLEELLQAVEIAERIEL